MIPVNLDKVTIRYPNEDDLDEYVKLEKDPDIKRFMGGPSQKSNEQIKMNLKDYKPSEKLLAIIESDTGKYIGRCGLLDTTQDSFKEIYLLLSNDFQRKGAGQQIIDFLCSICSENKWKPVAYIDPENTPSLKLMKKIGWVESGMIKEEKSNYQKNHLTYVPS